ncbi:hypothetical protein IG193_02435 [Infirmifilum lucidum]|uniref:Uncharacterized protein n=1 Tax=Infirmifilum lucidum TaxID=2776706 RepID=A0A7L9FHR2_9CREN|nr:hypothetical protein [Infirmifilum lucidum]QOJ79340.1 hypothetical protein IG193_02435 [Infirmifilum lucidum]
MELRARVASKSDVLRVISEARRNSVKRLVLEIVAQNPAEAAEVVREALGEVIPFTIEVRVVRSV